MSEENITINKRELLSMLEYAKNELDLLYHFAISHGIAEAGEPPHKQVGRFIEQIRKVSDET